MWLQSPYSIRARQLCPRRSLIRVIDWQVHNAEIEGNIPMSEGGRIVSDATRLNLHRPDVGTTTRLAYLPSFTCSA